MFISITHPEELDWITHWGATGICLALPDFAQAVAQSELTPEQLELSLQLANTYQLQSMLWLNAWLTPSEQESLSELLQRLPNPDWLVIQDPGLIALCRLHCPDSKILYQSPGPLELTTFQFWQPFVDGFWLSSATGLNQLQALRELAPALPLFIHVQGRPAQATSLLRPPLGSTGGCGTGSCGEAKESQPTWIEDCFELLKDAHGAYLLPAGDLCLLPWRDSLQAYDVQMVVEATGRSRAYQAICLKAWQQPDPLQALSSLLPVVENGLISPDLQGSALIRRHATGNLAKALYPVGWVREAENGYGALVECTARIKQGMSLEWWMPNDQGVFQTADLEKFDGEVLSQVQQGDIIRLQVAGLEAGGVILHREFSLDVAALSALYLALIQA